MANLTINGKSFDVDVEPNTPLLWAIRENIGLTGTKYGCGIAQCGACTVHIDGVATRSCGVLVSEAVGKQITTIEGLANNGALHKVQQAWVANDVPQCGYCQSGMIMAVAALLKEKPKPTDQDINDAITNICRCGTFQQVREAVRAADGSPEINAWVVIRPDDTVVIRIARSEMGQGTLTGLAQLVAEELECDWSKVTTEFPTPSQSVARKRAWGDFSTGGSRGIRTSQEYVRKSGATARVMLIQAAANEWKVPASECTAANSVITHTPSGKSTTYGKVVEAAARLTPPTEVKLKDPKDWKIAGKPVT